jgi:predicted nucleic acid-binding protein
MPTGNLVEQLDQLIQKLKESRVGIAAKIAEALKLKEEGDPIADQVIAAVAALTVDDFEAFADQAEKERELLKRVKGHDKA